jgi:HSP20 family protein
MPDFPWKPLGTFFDPDRQIEDAFRKLIHSKWGAAQSAFWHPEVDVYETPEAYVVEVDLPGVSLQELRIEVDEHRLTISGERRSAEFGQSLHGVWLERHRGQFFRQITLKHAVIPDSVRRECSEGQHRIWLTKRQPNE